MTNSNLKSEVSNLKSSLVLHRPLIPDAKKEELALAQTAAGVTLLRLGAADRAWPLFTHSPDPRVRSYLLSKLAPFGASPEAIAAQLSAETDVSRRRALILALGEFAKAGLFAQRRGDFSLAPVSRRAGKGRGEALGDQESLVKTLARLYADDPDPGIHGAAEWALRQLGAGGEIAKVRGAYSTGGPIGERRWYLTKSVTAQRRMGLPTRPGTHDAASEGPTPNKNEGPPGTGQKAHPSKETAASGLTFVILEPEEFLMGSPVAEAERFQGPTGKNEIRHRRRIGRRFAIGMHEITVAQFQAFRGEHDFDRTKAREADAPANLINWYDAVAYCNWLSKEEGIPPDQWCYDPQQKFAEGMTLLPDYLQRTGYRLPTEAEWEYACRAGAGTARYFGETEALLGEYAWYTKTSGDKWLLPVGSLKPNDFGLFDMQGNIMEWCQDPALLFAKNREWLGDPEQAGKLSNSASRVLRGGSFDVYAPYVRSAYRFAHRTGNRNLAFGFRAARTYPLAP